jgi:hypothetical protein
MFLNPGGEFFIMGGLRHFGQRPNELFFCAVEIFV